ncbi:kelch-like protein 33 [Gadus chalcogrammus]|uniref:kelch-like protein 33 n=1 Tax=Gadus chalcogrammus TaxID=1042646 RepID=UPI0024C48B3B|nr:kelch-like protein 33 [Gadus chalcogrammus]
MGPGAVPKNPSREEEPPQGGDAEQQEETDKGGGGGSRGPEEDGVLTYCCESHPEEVYAALRGLRECSLLTDLTLILGGRGAAGVGGATLRVHSPVLAAVSSLVRDALETRTRHYRAEPGAGGVRSWSLSLGPEVDPGGLQAVLDFAYSGDTTCLEGGTVARVRAAADALGVPRVLDLCAREGEIQKKQGEEGEEERRRRRAAEQMKASLRCVEELWEEGVGCDVVLDVDGTAVQAHRALLAASSDYFRGMFTCGMRESRQYRVSLPGLPPSELLPLVAFSYRGALPLGWAGVFELACAAHRLQFAGALTLCTDFMRREMTAATCLDVASFAGAYGAARLLADADDFVLRNFPEVAAAPAFPDLPPDRLQAYLGSDALVVPSELCAFRAAAAWVLADPEQRLAAAAALMRQVRFPLMTFREFQEVRAVALRGGGSPDTEFYLWALEEFSAEHPEARRRLRRPEDALVLVGGDLLGWGAAQRELSRELWFSQALRSGTGLLKDVEWRRLGALPDGPRFRHAVGVVRGRLHVVGGCDFYAPDDTMKSAYSYDPELDRWRRLADMQEARSSFSVVVGEDDLLYALGGDRQINTNVASVEVYNQQADSWSYARPLDQPLSGHASVHLSGDQVLITGGFDPQYRCLSSTLLYRPGRGTTRLADMAHERAQHVMEALRDGRGRCRRLYVAGGVRNLRAFYGDQLACEAYDFQAGGGGGGGGGGVGGTWSAFAPLPVAHVGAAAAVLEGRLYVLGGLSQEDFRETGLVHRYDGATGRWQSMGRMPGAVTDVRACLLRLPGRLRR